MRIGIFFGGQSREREISFAGGRTVYDNLNKNLFDAVPVFVDSLGNFILLDWQYVYKGTIRDFYPPFAFTPNSPNGFQIYIESLGNLSRQEQDQIIASVGKRIEPSQFSEHMDFAFLALHGPYGEDGNIQGILEWQGIPYSGSGILPSAIGINKIVQKKLMKQMGFNAPKNLYLSKKKWLTTTDKSTLYKEFEKELGLPFVIKAPYQGSSIGITVIKDNNLDTFTKAVYKSFFMQVISRKDWLAMSGEQHIFNLRTLLDIREGIGMPVCTLEGTQFNHPEELLAHLAQAFAEGKEEVIIESLDNEEEIVIEGFIKGKEFSCIVLQTEEGTPIALPPTEIVKSNEVFDYRSKYLPGMTRKVTPINLPEEQIQNIRQHCEKLFSDLQFNVYARLDGFITAEGEIFLNDPNTTSGMMPSSFFFHQAAEIGMNPSQFLTYLIRTSIAERIKTGKRTLSMKKLLNGLDTQLQQLQSASTQKQKVAVIMGGYSSERHISVESGRNIYEKLSSSSKYEPVPVFLTGSDDDHQLFLIPINIMLKDNADDIKEKVFSTAPKHPIIKKIQDEASSITNKYVSNYISEAKRINYEELKSLINSVFIALHGRPGEDGAVQARLEQLGIPYNGSGVKSSQTTINKFETNSILRENGILVANHMMVYKEDWDISADALLKRIESQFKYPIIAKPSDDGCSSAVKKIRNSAEMIAYIKLMFGFEDLRTSESAKVLGLRHNEEFPQKTYFVIEDLISKGDAAHFLEITGGMLTHINEDGSIRYEVFEPSEALATGDVLSLEEKFLAGEGQNITPPRFSKDAATYKIIAEQVKETLRRTAEILHVVGYCRIDAFVRIYENNKAETIIIEVNSLPGMTPATCIFHQTAINGYKPYDFIDRILTFGMQRQQKALATK